MGDTEKAAAARRLCCSNNLIGLRLWPAQLLNAMWVSWHLGLLLRLLLAAVSEFFVVDRHGAEVSFRSVVDRFRRRAAGEDRKWSIGRR